LPNFIPQGVSPEKILVLSKRTAFTTEKGKEKKGKGEKGERQKKPGSLLFNSPRYRPRVVAVPSPLRRKSLKSPKGTEQSSAVTNPHPHEKEGETLTGPKPSRGEEPRNAGASPPIKGGENAPAAPAGRT
jgi:hypothetical protein